MASATVVALLMALVGGVAATQQREAMSANPIRKVVTMLQAMEKKVTAEGEKEEELFEKFACYCKNGAGALSKSIADAESKSPSLVADIEEAESQVKQLKEDIKQHQADRAAAKEAMAKAKALREKQAQSFAAEKSEADANIAATTSAIAAITKGMSGSFLQTAGGQRLQQMVLSSSDMSDLDREEITAFLANKEGYAPGTAEINGILKQMKDTMEKALAESTAAEKSAIKSFQQLMASKSKEVDALTKSIEEKMVRLGDLQVSIVEMKEDLDDTGKSLLEDKKFLGDLSKNCKVKVEEHAENVKLRSSELVALADTIKVLNDDDALELFKKTLPSAASSFLQLQVTFAEQRRRALAAIKAAARKGRPELNFIALALQGKKVNFDEVLGMIDEMTSVLKGEQLDDDSKKEYCEMQFDIADDKKKGLQREVSHLETAIGKAKELIAALSDEIKALGEGIVALDKSVAEATEQRKEENKEFVELMASDGAAKELLGFAKNRLNKFYNPKLYKAPPKRELSEEDAITVGMGGTLAPTAAPGGIAGTGIAMAQISEHDNAKVAPPPPPETAAAYSKKSEESNGVIAMIGVMVADLDKEMTEAKATETLAQEEYEQTMKDSAEKRATDSKALADKEKAKAETAAALDENVEEKVATTKTLKATEKMIYMLHGECDWLLQYYVVRKEARAGEMESLKSAKAVLSGADYSLIETGVSHRSLRGRM
jgi:hypothetical protein